MPRYLFSLGAVPELSEAELRSLCDLSAIVVQSCQQKNGMLILETTQEIPISLFSRRLGGTLYIAEAVSTLGKEVVQAVTTYLSTMVHEGKIRFGLSGAREQVGVQIKKTLKGMGHSVRYVPIKNMASIVHNNLVDRGTHLTVHDGYLYVTRAVHDFAAMAAFDAQRPAIDSKSGMLPPKLARMMINIAGARETDTLLDPFCGSGTVLLEATTMGIAHVIGSDLSEKAVLDTKQNMDWCMGAHKSGSYDVMVADVRTLATMIPPASIDVIVTEPFMGKPKKGNEREDTLDQEIIELAALYAEALHTFATVLKPNGIVVFSKPRFAFQERWKTISWSTALAKTGFTAIPLLPTKEVALYARDGQLVAREIWKLQLQITDKHIVA